MPGRPSPEDYTYYDGETFRVEWYYTTEGELPAKEYFEGLSEVDQMSFAYIVKFIADNPFGTQLPQTMYRVEDKENKIYAFKARHERFFNFTTAGRRIVVTNAYHKHSRKMTKADMERLAYAARARQDYLRRVREGSYYGKED